MSISTTELGGQLAAEVYNQLLTIVRRELTTTHSQPRRQNWRFQPPQCSPALCAYWSNLYSSELAALEKEWAEPRAITPITSDTPNEENHAISQQAS